LAYSFQGGQLADELKMDLDKLSKLGVRLDLAAGAAKPTGIAAGIAIGFRIDPLLGIAVAGVGLLSKFATDGFKKNRINSIRQKWWRCATSMNEQQLQDFAVALQTKYPLLLPAARMLLGGGA
jgi:hypothetical protein